MVTKEICLLGFAFVQCVVDILSRSVIRIDRCEKLAEEVFSKVTLNRGKWTHRCRSASSSCSFSAARVSERACFKVDMGTSLDAVSPAKSLWRADSDLEG